MYYCITPYFYISFGNNVVSLIPLSLISIPNDDGNLLKPATKLYDKSKLPPPDISADDKSIIGSN